MARDSDRVEILREELRKSEAQLESLARRKAERLAASDPAGVSEAEERHTRTVSDIAALKRELAAVSRTATPASAEPVSAAAPAPKPVASPRSTSATKPAPATPWWDVYGKGRRVDPATPVSLAPAPDAVSRPVSARRLE